MGMRHVAGPELDAARACAQDEQVRTLRCVVGALVRQLAACGQVARVSRDELTGEPPLCTETYDAETDSALLAVTDEYQNLNS